MGPKTTNAEVQATLDRWVVQLTACLATELNDSDRYAAVCVWTNDWSSGPPGMAENMAGTFSGEESLSTLKNFAQSYTWAATGDNVKEIIVTGDGEVSQIVFVFDKDAVDAFEPSMADRQALRLAYGGKWIWTPSD